MKSFKESSEESSEESSKESFCVLFQDNDVKHKTPDNDSFATCALVALAKNRKKYGKEYDDFCMSHTKKNETDDSIKKITILIDSPKSFQKICRMAGKQMHTYGAAVDGCTKTLAVVLTAVKENFEKKLNDKEKKALGLSGKAADKITHYDLLEIGLYGRVSDTPHTVSDTFFRNQNLIEIYSEKHLPAGSGARDSSLPDQMVSKKTRNKDLYGTKVTISEDVRGEKTVGWEGLQNTDKIFIEKITAALDEYENGFGFFHPRSSQSDNSKALCVELHAALNNTTTTDTDKVSAVVNALSENKLSNGRFSKILKKAGFLDQQGNSTVPAPDAPATSAALGK